MESFSKYLFWSSTRKNLVKKMIKVKYNSQSKYQMRTLSQPRTCMWCWLLCTWQRKPGTLCTGPYRCFPSRPAAVWRSRRSAHWPLWRCKWRSSRTNSTCHCYLTETRSEEKINGSSGTQHSQESFLIWVNSTFVKINYKNKESRGKTLCYNKNNIMLKKWIVAFYWYVNKFKINVWKIFLLFYKTGVKKSV